ncbi:hypothetical protein C8R48DRAFT_778448 [Suillus tomentosus]|nr:hypothetical protein C8R48DRAFT_778448 [Suillus tomentosus]
MRQRAKNQKQQTPTQQHFSEPPPSSLSSIPGDISVTHATPTNTYNDSSSSDSDTNNVHILYSHNRKMTKSVRVEQAAPNKPPKLLAGELTPEVARNWDNACTTYFMHKTIAAADQVKMVAFGMLDARLHTWYLAQRAMLDAGTFEEYMTALKDAWLESHWDTKLRRKVLGSQQGSRSFYEWALELQNQMHYYTLRNQLEANMCEELTIPVLRANLADTSSLKTWIEEVKHLDDKRLEDLASHKRIAEDIYKASKRNAFTNNKTSSSKAYNPSSSSASCLGSLTETERTLLMKHRGCFKCRKFYVSHQSKDCTDGAPDASAYKTLTELDALAAKPKSRNVATVGPVGAVMPSTVIEEGSDSEDDMYVAPFETSHLIWPCLLTGPLCDSFERIDALIDHGSHLVLINEDVVKRLGLRRRKLHTVIEANSAFADISSTSTSHCDSVYCFSEYVLLSPSTIDHGWTSRTIRAIIAPKLAVLLLLGGPFLSHNSLIIDHGT